MSDERADAIPEAAVEAAMRAAYDAFPQSWGPTGNPKTYEECYGMTPLEHTDDVAEMRAALAAAAPHMTGSGEAEQGRALVHRLFALDRLSPEWEQALAELRAWSMSAWDAQPDTERAPQEDEGAMRNRLNALADKHGAPRPNRYTPSAMASQPDAERAPQGPCPTCGGRGWHTAGGNDPAACGMCEAGEIWEAGPERAPQPEPHQDEQ